MLKVKPVPSDDGVVVLAEPLRDLYRSANIVPASSLVPPAAEHFVRILLHLRVAHNHEWPWWQKMAGKYSDDIHIG